MNEHENDFEALGRLLALKRRETPPPGYFNDFSNQVLRRIRAGQAETSTNLLEGLFGQASWLAKFSQVFSAKPVFASGFAGALCLLLFFGIVYAERPDLTPQPLLSVATTTASLAAVSPTSLSQPAEQTGIMSSTDPVFSLQPAGSPFGRQNPLAQPVSFQIPAN